MQTQLPSVDTVHVVHAVLVLISLALLALGLHLPVALAVTFHVAELALVAFSAWRHRQP